MMDDLLTSVGDGDGGEGEGEAGAERGGEVATTIVLTSREKAARGRMGEEGGTIVVEEGTITPSLTRETPRSHLNHHRHWANLRQIQRRSGSVPVTKSPPLRVN